MSLEVNKMSCKAKVMYFKEKVEQAIEFNVSPLEILRMYTSFYCVVKDEIGKSNLVNQSLSFVKSKYEDIADIVHYILSNNIIIKSKKMIFNHWIFINENIVRREVLVIKKNHGYEVIDKVDYPSIHYSNINKQ